MNTYTLEATDLLLTSQEQESLRTYTLKIKDMPTEDQPRERLLKYGPAHLSVQELIAIILATGTKKEDLLSMSARVVKDYGELALMNQADARQLSGDLDIPLIKAMQLIACGELGRRFFQKTASGLALIRTAQDVYEYTRDMHALSKEHLRGIYLNNHYRVIHDEVISIGTVDSNLIHPREVFKPAIGYSAAGVILVHNHPSGVVQPSEADVEVTRQIIAAGKIIGIHVIDHVIVGSHGFISIQAEYV